MAEIIETILKITLALLAIVGGKDVVDRIVIKFSKKESHNNFSVNSSESVGGDKVVINNYYNFPGIGNSSEVLSQEPNEEISQTDFTQPPKLSEEQEDLCKRLDSWHQKYGLTTKPSDMFRGALFVARSGLRQNPDWIAQSAHSLRDILYPFGSVAPNKIEALKQNGSVFGNDQNFIDEFGRIYGTLTELAHHGNGRGKSVDFETFKPSDFENIIADFERVMRDALLRQLDVHSEIDSMLDGLPTT